MTTSSAFRWTSSLCLAASIVCSSNDNEVALTKTISFSIDIGIWVLSTFILLGIESYWLYQTVRKSGSIIILKRKPGILLISICCLLSYVIINSTIVILNNELQQQMGISSHMHIIIAVIVCVTFPLWYVYVYFSCARYWLLFYSIKWSASCSKTKWYTIIAASVHNDDWYLLNKKSYGSWNWIKKRLLYITFFCSVYNIAFIVSMKLILMLLLVHAIFTVLLPLIFCFSLQCRIPAFDDNIGLREELKFCNITFVFIVFTSILYQIVFTLYYDGVFQSNSSLTNVFWSSWFLLVRICIFIINLKQTRWPLIQFKSVLKTYSTQTVIDLAHQETTQIIALEEQEILRVAASNSNSISLNLSPPHSIRLRMKNALRNSGIFTRFMERLLSEHSAECLLSIIEFIQFQKKCYIDFSNNDSIPSNISNNDFIDLPNDNDFPQSCIVYRCFVSRTINHYKIMVKELYDKYIKCGSDYEINIDALRRRSYKKLLGNDEQWIGNKEYDDYKRLCTIFNQCIEQMASLITASFVIWSDTTEYKRLQKQIIDK